MALSTSVPVQVLAWDLGIRRSTHPVTEILRYCQKQVEQFLASFPDCATPAVLLELVANKLGTHFLEIHDDEDLRHVQAEYGARHETGFARLDQEFESGTLGITIKLLHPIPGELPYVSIIDYRDSKRLKAYFTKWHEIGHLLILTDQRRLSFKRTHSLHEEKSDEESLVDVIAGAFAYYPPMVRPLADGEISFEKIETIRRELCADGSFTSAIIGVTKAWPSPCILIEAKMATKKGENPNQTRLGFAAPPAQALRAVNVTINDVARKRGIQLHRNFRVPSQSIIAKVFHEQLPDGEAVENLDWWNASDGSTLQQLRVLVKTKQLGNAVHALLIPTN